MPEREWKPSASQESEVSAPATGSASEIRARSLVSPAARVADFAAGPPPIQREAVDSAAGGAGEQQATSQPNRTGLPDRLKSGIENLSGYAMDDVRVHYGSSKPAGVGALAYTQGANIYVGPGQEKHLPHEAWHVVQQKQGRVKPTMRLDKGVDVNDDAGLEREATEMGERAMQLHSHAAIQRGPRRSGVIAASCAQMMQQDEYDLENDRRYAQEQQAKEQQQQWIFGQQQHSKSIKVGNASIFRGPANTRKEHANYAEFIKKLQSDKSAKLGNPLLKTSVLGTKSQSFGKMFDGTSRESNIEIKSQKVHGGYRVGHKDVNRPYEVSGTVQVTSTKGRKAAPNPVSGFKTTHYEYDKGHLFALELGGPDKKENIVPQWSNFQRTQRWRRMEVRLHDEAVKLCKKDPDARLHVLIQAHYNDQRDVHVPASFDVTATVQGTDSIILKETLANEPDERDLELAPNLEAEYRARMREQQKKQTMI